MLKTYFKDITKELDIVTSFINTVNGQTLSEEDIKTVFNKANYLEKFFTELKNKNLDRNLIDKIKQYKEVLGQPVPEELDKIENLCDTLMVKLFSQMLNDDLASTVVKTYLQYCGSERLEYVMSYMVEVRTAFLKLSNLVQSITDPINIQSVLLIESWCKICRTHTDGENTVSRLVEEMLGSKKTMKILFNILILKEDPMWEPVQRIIFLQLSHKLKSYDKEVWLALTEEEATTNELIKQYPDILDVIFDFLTYTGSKLHFCHEKSEWINLEDAVLNYQQIISSIRVLVIAKKTKRAIKKFFNAQKSSECSELWKSVEDVIFPLK